jgi:hypothetical protein
MPVVDKTIMISTTCVIFVGVPLNIAMGWQKKNTRVFDISWTRNNKVKKNFMLGGLEERKGGNKVALSLEHSSVGAESMFFTQKVRLPDF